jgi:hypothetical protein
MFAERLSSVERLQEFVVYPGSYHGFYEELDLELT